MNKVILRFIIAVSFVFAAHVAYAATYYVDFVSGKDGNDGLSQSTPFQHSPGDVNATLNAEALLLAAGDKVIFKGGVKYKGRINAAVSGSSAAPITFDGNSAGTYGTGKAIIDGSEPLAGWSQCSLNGSKAARLYCTSLPAGADPFALNIYEGDSRAILAQTPQPSNYFRTDNISEYFSVAPAQLSTGVINDPTNLSSFVGNWGSAKLVIWGGANLLYTQNITGYSSGKLSYEAVKTYTDRPTRYAIMNHPYALTNPGEYYVDVATKIIYYSPYGTSPVNVTYSVRDIGIAVQANYVKVKGFIVQKHKGGVAQSKSGIGIAVAGKSTTAPITGDMVESNEVRFNYSAEKGAAIHVDLTKSVYIGLNHVHHNVPNRGILVQRSDTPKTDSNKIDYAGGTGIAYFTATNGVISNNVLTNISGVHANGITLYIGSHNNVVNHNNVNIDGIALTTQASGNLTIAFNFLKTSENSYTMANWASAGASGLKYRNNVILNPYKKALYVSNDAYTGLVIVNNIMDGLAFQQPTGVPVDHNVYTTLFYLQSTKYGWKLSEGEAALPLTSVFVAPASNDYRLNAVSSGTLSKGNALQPPCCTVTGSAYIGHTNKYY